ncbi:hypothetical protein [Paraburkholderia atlantica]|uniref:hypothetical protein n=1 Tax=Paraburkholderia atlantica TaxID=2654982 RepID=UPI00160E7855|nr:hypothetical protein [Paraburkholderia atlantica]MBB5509607.1 hypothetical protein [Paraburkholderia atlantica]
MTAPTSKPGAEMELTDEQIVALALENGFYKSAEHWGDRYVTQLGSDLVRFARALLARQPAAIDKQAEIARIRYGALRDAENIARLFDLGTPDGHAIADSIRKLAEAERAEQPAAPSVEQDERGALVRMANDMRAEQTFLGSCRETCDDSGRARWDRVQRVIDYLDRAASPSANVAQGAEAVAWESTTPVYRRFITDARYQKLSPEARKWYRPYRCPHCSDAAPPAQPALTDDARDAIRRAALKEAAGVCDVLSLDYNRRRKTSDNPTYLEGKSDGAEACGSALIRLAAQPASEAKGE